MTHVSELHNTSGDIVCASSADPCPPLQTLHHWSRANIDLSFVYARSKGGLLQVGRARISALGETMLQLDAIGSKLNVVIAGARLGAEPQLFFSHGFLSSFYVDGVSVHLENHDWLFMSSSADPESLSFNSGNRNRG